MASVLPYGARGNRGDGPHPTAPFLPAALAATFGSPRPPFPASGRGYQGRGQPAAALDLVYEPGDELQHYCRRPAAVLLVDWRIAGCLQESGRPEGLPYNAAALFGYLSGGGSAALELVHEPGHKLQHERRVQRIDAAVAVHVRLVRAGQAVDQAC